MVSDRDVELLNKGPTILIRLLTEFNSLTDAAVILLLNRAGGTTLMVESPQFFMAYRPVLAALQVRRQQIKLN